MRRVQMSHEDGVGHHNGQSSTISNQHSSSIISVKGPDEPWRQRHQPIFPVLTLKTITISSHLLSLPSPHQPQPQWFEKLTGSVETSWRRKRRITYTTAHERLVRPHMSSKLALVGNGFGVLAHVGESSKAVELWLILKGCKEASYEGFELWKCVVFCA
ncbi:hypothetical protein EJ02DRAFT_155116 [Clathrospora elynae]|uniref:Uncharacterized protein n=1 Tax=Clathrospora elynae TaxID=706981 RepID=A0A6A5SQL8_9PLEO|nr:hypothetical protein EJ02DRAFT_155116 [Clathrospora elynae]